MKKVVSSVLIMAIMVGLLVGSVYANAVSNKYKTPALTAGSWWSGVDSNVVAITASTSKVYGGDVGVSFYATSVGMPVSFVRSSDRTIDIELKEKDPFSNCVVRQYVGYFSIKNGLYRVPTYTTTYTNAGCVEDNSVLELYMRFKVNTISGDTSKNVPEGLIIYEMWAN